MKILVPTDCSAESGIALKAASQLAQKFNAEIIALKVVHAPVDAFYNKEGELIIDDEEFDSSQIQKDFDEGETQIIEWANSQTVKVNPLVKMGLMIDTILATIEKQQINVVVMQSDTTSGLKKIVHGPIVERIVLNSSVPVLTIKETFSGFRNLAFANNFRRSNIEIGFIKSIQETFNSTLHLVRVNTPKKFMSEDEAKKSMADFATKHGLKEVVIHCVNGKTIDHALADFCKIYKIDIMAMGSKQRTRFVSMMKGCPSKDLVNNLAYPVLTFQSIKK